MINPIISSLTNNTTKFVSIIFRLTFKVDVKSIDSTKEKPIFIVLGIFWELKKGEIKKIPEVLMKTNKNSSYLLNKKIQSISHFKHLFIVYIYLYCLINPL